MPKEIKRKRKIKYRMSSSAVLCHNEWYKAADVFVWNKVSAQHNSTN